jgi:NADH dehydrogenase
MGVTVISDGPVVVTGAAGFLGRRIVREISAMGRPVRAIVRQPDQRVIVDLANVEAVEADVTDAHSLAAAMTGASLVVHSAAILRERGGATYESVNVQGAQRVFQAAVDAGIPRGVLVSVVGAEQTSSVRYLNSRGKSEAAARASGIDLSIARLSALFGEGDEFANALAALVRLGPFVPVIGSGNSCFQPLSADDAAYAIARLAHSPAHDGEILELGGPDVLDYSQIVDLIADSMGRRTIKIHLPLLLMRPVIRIMELLTPNPPVTTELLNMLNIDNVASGSSFEELFDRPPRPMRDNIDYVNRVGILAALRIMIGHMPKHIRDH